MPAAPGTDFVRMSRFATAACLAAGVLLLTACGSSTRDPRAPTHAFTKEDGEIAKAADVQQADVPVLENRNIERTITAVMDLVLSRVETSQGVAGGTAR